MNMKTTIVLTGFTALLSTGCIKEVDEDHPILKLDQVPDFNLADVGSPEDIYSPKDFQGHAAVYFFGHATCGYCRNQFGLLDEMAEKLDEMGYPDIGVMGINQIGYEVGNESAIAEADSYGIPWLQDNPDNAVWANWSAFYRDAIVVGPDLKAVVVQNLSELGIQEKENYDMLLDAILDAEKSR